MSAFLSTSAAISPGTEAAEEELRLTLESPGEGLKRPPKKRAHSRSRSSQSIDSGRASTPRMSPFGIKYKKGEVVSQPGGVRKKFNGKQWRKLCTRGSCDKESQKQGLCSRHLSIQSRSGDNSEASADTSPATDQSSGRIASAHDMEAASLLVSLGNSGTTSSSGSATPATTATNTPTVPAMSPVVSTNTPNPVGFIPISPQRSIPVVTQISPNKQSVVEQKKSATSLSFSSEPSSSFTTASQHAYQVSGAYAMPAPVVPVPSQQAENLSTKPTQSTPVSIADGSTLLMPAQPIVQTTPSSLHHHAVTRPVASPQQSPVISHCPQPSPVSSASVHVPHLSSAAVYNMPTAAEQQSAEADLKSLWAAQQAAQQMFAQQLILERQAAMLSYNSSTIGRWLSTVFKFRFVTM